MSVRDDLLAVITAAVPAGTHVIPYQDNVDVPDRMTVMFKQLAILPLASAPRSGYEVRYVLTVIAPGTDPQNAEADLDAFVLNLLGDLDALDWFAWTAADKVLFQENRMAYDISCWNLGYKATAAATPTTAPPTRTPRKGAKAHA